MKKNVLTLAVAGAVAASAQANMYVNPDNTGEVLIYPFYTADAGNQTYIHVVNTTEYYKAAKVRIHEAENSYEVRDFNLYLSPYDHFAFTIRLDEETGGGMLKTVDTSCTVPRLYDADPEVQAEKGLDGTVSFDNILYKNAKDANTSYERTLNGYVEIIEMGQFEGAATTSPGYMWKHVKGIPRDCQGVEDLWSTGGAWFEEVPQGGGTKAVARTGELSTWQGGGLYGMGIIVNPEAGAAIGFDAVAIDAFHESAEADTAGGDLHYYPGDVDPSLQGREDYTATDSTVFVNGTQKDYDTSSNTTPTLDAVSSLFMVESIMNDYVLDSTFMGRTDWVVTFPTKRNYVKDTTGTSRARDPFYDQWEGGGTEAKQACDPYWIRTYDREEQYPTPDVDRPPFSPYTDDPTYDPKICHEANVLTFTKPEVDPVSAMWGTSQSESSKSIHVPIETPYENGWAHISFDWGKLVGTYTGGPSHQLVIGNETLKGLPAIGFSVIKFERGTLEKNPGVLANYAAAHEHKTSRASS